MSKGILMRALVATILLLPGLALAEGQDQADAAADGGFVFGAKVGGIAPFSGLSPFAMFGIEAGYALPESVGITLLLNVDYTQPTTTGTETDPRVMGGTYTWQLTEQMLGIMPVALLHLPRVSSLRPYVSMGPRLLLARSTVEDNGTPPFMATEEESTRIGIAVAVGTEVVAGPGRFTAELLFQYGTLHHVATGGTNTGALSLAIGYRFRL